MGKLHRQRNEKIAGVKEWENEHMYHSLLLYTTSDAVDFVKFCAVDLQVLQVPVLFMRWYCSVL
jgi:hypothetical protein